jgi:hypothetical protein
MPKTIAVVSYDVVSDNNGGIVCNELNKLGYSAEHVHQWVFNETNPATFRKAAQWKKYDGIVMSGDFYAFWTLRELIRSGRPVICMNRGYVDDLGLGETTQDHPVQSVYKVVNATHPITAGAGLAPGTFDFGEKSQFTSVSTHNHHVDVLLTTLASEPTLVAHKTERYTYFPWWRFESYSPENKVYHLLKHAAHWTFGGP